MIKLHCPNGHKVTCPDDKIGQSGKCPKCGARFLVPSSKDEGNGETASEDVIVFLCPNGHKLNGPVSLQGQPGQCPHCNARFVIPTYDDDEQVYEPGEGPGAGWSAENDDAYGEQIESIEPLPDGDTNISRQPAATAGSVPSTSRASTEPGATSSGAPSLAQVFDRLWQQRTSGGIIEVHLTSGERIKPVRYSTSMSTDHHALFAVTDDDGSQTLVAVAWDAVASVSVRGVKSLPAGMFVD